MPDQVAAMTGWAATCAGEEGALGNFGVVTTTGSAAKCTAKQDVLYGTGMEITTLSSVNSTVQVLILVCLRFATTTGSVETCSVTMS